MSKINGEKSIKDKLENIKKKIENSHSNITINEFLDQFEEIMLNELKEEDLILIKDFFKSGYVKKIKLLFISEENDKEILMRKLKELEEKIETLEIEISKQKSINEIQKKNISDLEKQRIEQESINQRRKHCGHLSHLQQTLMSRHTRSLNPMSCQKQNPQGFFQSTHPKA